MHASAEPRVAAASNFCALEKAEVIAAQFEFSDDEISVCVQKFLKQMDEGLQERKPAMCQIPTYVTRVASGKEKGAALGVDLGGTNLRVCLVELYGDTSYNAVHTKYAVPPELMVTHEAAELFAFIAMQIEVLLRTHRPDCLSGSGSVEAFSLGLTFSFPVYQNAINSGTLLRWTKGFDIPSVIGQDVCELLQHQIDIRKLPVTVRALVNDAAGTIMSRAYCLPVNQTHTSIGAIFGTGTNGVYLEKLSKISKPLEGHFDLSTGEMFISIEWGSFDNELAVLPSTEYDVEVDQASINPGNQMFEKRVSGMFLGELLRTVLAKLHVNPAVRLFDSLDSSISLGNESRILLNTRWAVDSSILSVAESDDTEDLAILRRKIVDALGIPLSLATIEDAQIVKLIAHAIGKRAARMGGMALGAVILKTEQLGNTEDFGQSNDPQEIDRREQIKDISANQPAGEDLLEDPIASPSVDGRCLVDIGVDGSVIEFYPRFEGYMREALRAVRGIGTKGEKMIRMGITKDGSSVGAAIIALIAAQQA
ncbi:MAG: hypothetical protein Q9214_004697 [Letrouitia sp. 1 TL-2023]